MEKTTHTLPFKKTDSGDTLLGKNKGEVILLCDWYCGLTNSMVDANTVEEIKRMETLN